MSSSSSPRLIRRMSEGRHLHHYREQCFQRMCLPGQDAVEGLGSPPELRLLLGIVSGNALIRLFHLLHLFRLEYMIHKM